MTTADRIREIAGPIRDRWRALRPEWRTTDSPLKYVDWAMEETIAKSTALAMVLHQEPFSWVAELGPGAGYLLATLQDRKCRVVGYDLADRPLYRETAEALGVTVHDWVIAPDHLPTPAGSDLIVGTQISWLNAWTAEEGRNAVGEWLRCLRPGGRLALWPNPQAFGGADPGEVWAAFRPVELTMKHLGRGFIFSKESTP
jgi:SAM-dependent methyltransferase